MSDPFVKEFLARLSGKPHVKNDRRALSRVLSLMENRESSADEVLRSLAGRTGTAYRIGFTGPPGAGKSCLVNGVARLLADEGRSVGIIAVDPTSPFTGGAILGDRLRMHDVALHPNVFVRSMATRGSVGGLARAAAHAADLMDAFGMDYVLLETVGVGQSEIDIVEHADTTLVVLVPESGDEVQAMKAGLMEVADIIVVNKADRQQADALKKELESALAMRPHDASGWIPPVMLTVATQQKGVEELLQQIQRHRRMLETSALLTARRKARIRHELLKLIEERFLDRWSARDVETELDRHVGDVFEGKESAYDEAENLFKRLTRPSRS
jgi:LAO/AO transport system kinase